MSKVCVFCGNQPESKTLEHVLPQWLIELTGNAKRKAEFGYKHLENGKLVKRTFSFDAFKFPACKSCNQSFSELEAKTKATVQKILTGDPLSSSELSTLLDWFDKIRIGLWLAFQYLDKNTMGIEPHYHIEARIGQHDRMLAIFKMDANKLGLNFAGCDTPAFALAPCCFTIRINDFCFLNMSYPNLLSRRMGFPYPSGTFMMEDERLFCRFTKGRDRIMLPVLKKLINIQGTELYQPIFIGNIRSADTATGKRRYDTKYVRDNCISWERGVGKIFINVGPQLSVYPDNSSKEWIPKKTYDFEDLLFEIQILAFDWQMYIDSLRPSLKLISKETRRAVIKKRNLSRYYNKELLRILLKRHQRLS